MKPYSNLPNFGAKTYPDGSEYNGSTETGLVLKYSIGQLTNGKRQGKGRWIKKKFECYDGDWNNDKYHGSGVLIMPST